MRAPVMFCSLFENRTSTPVRRTASGDGKKTAEHDPVANPVADPDEGAIPVDPDGEVITFSGDTGTFSPLSGAAALYTGEDASVQRLTAEGGELFKDLQAIANVMTDEIVTGYGDGKFGPMDPLTREQLATILYRCAKAKELGFTGLWAFPLTFDDASEVSDWAYEAVCWMVMQGVIQGTGSNKLSPKGMASRAQVATMLMRYNAAEQELLRQTMEAAQISRQTAVSTLSYEKWKARNSINEMN